MADTLTVTQIQRSAIHDGPGLRTVVFLQGCPLRCPWCCNPETRALRPVLLRDNAKCVGCGACAQVCKTGAAHIAGGRLCFERARCAACGRCVDVCPEGAVELSGRAMTLDEILRVVHGDDAYYAATGGGLTVSGGEPLLQANVLKLIERAAAEGLSVYVETTACVPPEVMERAAALVDGFYIDYKHADAQKLMDAAGASLPVIQHNIERMAAMHAPVTLRTPVIPGFNDDEAALAACFEFAKRLGFDTYVLLPYHALGKRKYALTGLPCAYDGVRTLTPDELRPFVLLGERMGLSVRIGG